MTNFVIEFHAPVELTKEQRKRRIDEAVANCAVHNTLMHAGKISRRVSALVLAAKNGDLRD